MGSLFEVCFVENVGGTLSDGFSHIDILASNLFFVEFCVGHSVRLTWVMVRIVPMDSRGDKGGSRYLTISFILLQFNTQSLVDIVCLGYRTVNCYRVKLI